MPKYDVENLLSDIQSLLTTYLNTKLSEIDTEKNDGITLKQVDSSAYFLQTLDGKAANFDPFILYGVDTIESDGRRSATLRKYQISVVIVLADSRSEVTPAARMFRYLRALEEVFEEHWAENGNAINLVIQSLEPVEIKLFNTSQPYRAVGVRFEAGLA